MNTKINLISRYGAYGIVLQNKQLLLTLKKTGPYKGLWELPGGGIEFGETPKETLRREFLEEVTLKVGQVELITVVTSKGRYNENGCLYDFHHIGIIYKVLDSTLEANLIPEDEGRYFLLSEINSNNLTPFAKCIYNHHLR